MAQCFLQARRGISDIEGTNKHGTQVEVLLEAQRHLWSDKTKAEIKENRSGSPPVPADWDGMRSTAEGSWATKRRALVRSLMNVMDLSSSAAAQV